MKRSQVLLAILAAILLVALFYVLLFQPKRDEVAELEVQIAAELDEQALIQAEIDRLRAVRDEAPEVEAELAAAEAIVPRDPALPAALRQLQLAADESGLVLQAVTAGRPVPIEPVDGAPPDGQAPDTADTADTADTPDEEGAPSEQLSSIDVDVQLVGSYFQVVDFLRRVEDPAITPRGLTWNNATIAREEYPSLNVTLSGQIYAFVEVPPPPETEQTPDPEANDPATDDPNAPATDEDANADTADVDDVDVDVDDVDVDIDIDPETEDVP